MRASTFRTELWLPRRRAEVFDFFSDAANLERITPPFLRFRIETPLPIEMKSGALIDYRLRVRGVPIRWRTEIRSWDPPLRFVDVQLKGPYRLWEHTHEFEERDGGTLCRDTVRYAVWCGALVERLFIRREVKLIFAYREQVLRQLFELPAPRRVAGESPCGSPTRASGLARSSPPSRL